MSCLKHVEFSNEAERKRRVSTNEIGSESDEEFFMLPSWTNHVTELEYYQWLRMP